MGTSIRGGKHLKEDRVQVEGKLIYGTDKRPDEKDRKSEIIFMGAGPDDTVTGEERAHKKALSLPLSFYAPLWPLMRVDGLLFDVRHKPAACQRCHPSTGTPKNNISTFKYHVYQPFWYL